MGDISAKSQELSKKLGKTPREIEYEVRLIFAGFTYRMTDLFFSPPPLQAWHPTAGEVVELPGLGKLYDYECSLQLGAGDVCYSHFF